MWGYSFEEMAKIASEEAAKLAVSNISILYFVCMCHDFVVIVYCKQSVWYTIRVFGISI